MNVLSKEEMDILLKNKWEGMREKLSEEDIDNAITYFEENSQDTYKTQFTALKTVLNTIANDMGQINLVKIQDDRAEYEIIVTRGSVEYSYHLLFVRDKDGLWKIKRF